MSTRGLTKNVELPMLFDDFFKPWNGWFNNREDWGSFSMPAVNVIEEDDNYKLSLAAPGLKKEYFQVKLDGNMLTISCEKEESKDEKDGRYTRKEYNYSSFNRSFGLPDNVKQDKIEATYEDGVLKLVLPKKDEARNQPSSKNIKVQ